MKAALLSAFVFPGTGHLFLKKLISGTVLACAACACLYVLISESLEKALQITDKILTGEVTPDVVTMTELLSKQSTGNEDLLLNVAWYVLIATWLIGIVSAYLSGRVKNNAQP